MPVNNEQVRVNFYIRIESVISLKALIEGIGEGSDLDQAFMFLLYSAK